MLRWSNERNVQLAYISRIAFDLIAVASRCQSAAPVQAHSTSTALAHPTTHSIEMSAWRAQSAYAQCNDGKRTKLARQADRQPSVPAAVAVICGSISSTTNVHHRVDISSFLRCCVHVSVHTRSANGELAHGKIGNLGRSSSSSAFQNTIRRHRSETRSCAPRAAMHYFHCPDECESRTPPLRHLHRPPQHNDGGGAESKGVCVVQHDTTTPPPSNGPTVQIVFVFRL